MWRRLIAVALVATASACSRSRLPHAGKYLIECNVGGRWVDSYLIDASNGTYCDYKASCPNMGPVKLMDRKHVVIDGHGDGKHLETIDVNTGEYHGYVETNVGGFTPFRGQCERSEEYKRVPPRD
jgi:hypothetical protein